MNNPPRIWTNCPTCNGAGSRLRYWFGENNWWEPGDTFHRPPSKYERKENHPCPTCANHYADLDKAVAENRDKILKLLDDECLECNSAQCWCAGQANTIRKEIK